MAPTPPLVTRHLLLVITRFFRKEWLTEYTDIKYQYNNYASGYSHMRTPHRANPEKDDII